MKIKRILLSELRLNMHPTVAELSKGDCVKCQAPPAVDFLSEQELQILLSKLPLSVLTDSEENTYILLEKSLPFELLKQHPRSHLCRVYLHIFNEDEADAVIKTLLLQHAALHYQQFDSIASNLFYRHKNAKNVGLKTPTIRKLSALSNLSTSAIRPKKRRT
ncbi:hypothetical protein [Parashewanella tropica]|uniref:hypothetical protein n=1 Tax=Parashewanella tropica TaxID=2547970 RepID=UPI00105A6115|nr:hypothetical protein [Parashewanella tropica]